MNIPHKQRGFGLLEMSVAIGIGLIATVSGVKWYKEYTDQTVFTVAADQHKQLSQGLAAYLRDHHNTVKNTLPANGSVSTTAVTLKELSDKNYIPKHYFDNPSCATVASCVITSPYLQQYRIASRRVGTAPNDGVEAMLYTQPSDKLSQREAMAIAKRIGATGGMVDISGNKIVGSLGGWEVSATTFGAAGLAGDYAVASAIFFQDEMQIGDYLHRNDVPGRPDLNRMNTNLDLGGNDINSAKDITASGTAASDGLKVGNTASAPGPGEAMVRNNIESEAGWLIARTGGVQSNVMRSVASDGAGQGQASWVNSGGQLRFQVNRGMSVSGTLSSTGRLSTGEYLDLGGTATEGAACAKNGLVAKDASGALLSCQSGSWKAPGKSSGGSATFHNLTAGYGSTNTQAIQPISTHHCALSVSQSRNDNHVNTHVYQSGSYWYLRVYSVGNAGIVTGGAVCWPK